MKKQTQKRKLEETASESKDTVHELGCNSRIREIAIPAEYQMSAADFEYVWSLRPAEKRKRKMFGKQTRVPRYELVLGRDYYFANKKYESTPIPEGYLKRLHAFVNAHSKADYQGMLINFYENGQDSVDWHSDNERDLLAGEPIYSLSFGETRGLSVRPKKGRTCLKLVMKNNTALIMEGEMQEHFEHAVLKMAVSKAPGRRVNITFRRFKP